MKLTTTGLNMLLLPIILIKSINCLTCLKYEKGLSDQQVTETCEDKNPEPGPSLCFTAWHQDNNGVKTIFRQGCFSSVPGNNICVMQLI